MRMGMDMDVDAAGTGRSLSVCKQGENSERLPFCCLSIARLLRAAMADRSFHLVETLPTYGTLLTMSCP
jgi:hypothetical protein